MKIALLIVNIIAASNSSNPIQSLNFLCACFLAGLIVAEVVNYFVAE